MLGRSHQICSIAIVEGFAVGEGEIGPLSAGIGLLVGTSIGALLPDMDQKNSKINKKLPVDLGSVFTHRGVTHGILFWVLFCLVLWAVMNLIYPFSHFHNGYFMHFWSSLYLGLIFGYFLHLFEDSFSQAGIRWLAPFSPYDTAMWDKYHTLLRKPHRYSEDSEGHRHPVRHWWGRGYKVGGSFETVCDWLAVVAILYYSWIYVSQLVSNL